MESSEPSTSTPTLWRIHLKTDNHAGSDPVKYCRDTDVVGMGWQIDGGLSDPEAWDEYSRLATSKYGTMPHNVTRFAREMQNNDLCWMRTTTGKYYLGRIVGGWKYAGDSGADVCNIRPCEWVEVGELTKVPGKVLNSFRSPMTLQKVADVAALEYSLDVFNRLNKKSFRYELPQQSSREKAGDLFSLLSPGDCEDIVALFLQDRGYLIFPSTAKPDTKKWEFELRHRDTKRLALVQVKQGSSATLDPNEYAAENEDVFLFQTSGKYPGTTASNVTCLKPDELKKFCLDHVDLMREPVQAWIKQYAVRC